MFGSKYCHYITIAYKDMNENIGIHSYIIIMPKNPKSTEFLNTINEIEKTYNYKVVSIIYCKRLEKIK